MEPQAAAPTPPPVDIPSAPLPSAPTQPASTATGADAPPHVVPEDTAGAPQPEPAATPVAPPVEPLWSDEQWAEWDGSRDSLDSRYHAAFDRISAAGQSTIETLEQRLERAHESLRALAWGEDDPNSGADLAEANTARDAAIARAEAAEAALNEYKAEQERKLGEQEDAEVQKFRNDHAWVFADDTPQPVRAAIARLIDNGVLPTSAGDIFKGVEPKRAEILAASILRGDSVDTARELADLRLAPPKYAALPEPLPGAEFVAGSDPASPTNRRTRTVADANSHREARVIMAEQMLRHS